jgi:hypothetical protein
MVPAFAIAAAVGVLLMAAWINPINKTVNSWTPESLPPNWPDFRDRWHLLHTVRFLLSAVAFGALIRGLMAA